MPDLRRALDKFRESVLDGRFAAVMQDVVVAYQSLLRARPPGRAADGAGRPPLGQQQDGVRLCQAGPSDRGRSAAGPAGRAAARPLTIAPPPPAWHGVDTSL